LSFALVSAVIRVALRGGLVAGRGIETRELFCFLTPFRHLSKRPFIHTGGERGKAECGASAEGWRERFALR
jgi:hypothetical protein